MAIPLFVLVLCVTGVFCDKDVTVGGITTRVLGRSGKIAVLKGKDQNSGVTITFDAIREIADTGDKIQTKSYENFASLDFKFSDTEQGTYQDSEVNVTMFNFTADIPAEKNDPMAPKASLTSYVYVFTAEGNITVEGNNVSVTAGTMKFDIRIDNWNFCKACKASGKNVEGKYLDFVVSIKGKSTPKKRSGNSGTFDLGDDATVLVPRQVYVSL